MEQTFKHLVDDCVTTNNLKPEYEMWLHQDVYNDINHKIQFHKYLQSLTLDENGWVYWFLYETDSKKNDILRNDYLEKSIQCNNEYAICEDYNDKEKLLQMAKNGNPRAYYQLYLLCDKEKGKEFLFNGIIKGDFMCVYTYTHINKRTVVSNPAEKKINVRVNNLLEGWCYHEKNISVSIAFPTNEDIQKLIKLGIPCAYYFLSDDLKDKEKVIHLDKGRKLGCRRCDRSLKCTLVGVEDYLKVLKENETLKALKSQTLEEIVKNVISEYI
jgi:hypothetical protein